MWKNFDEKEQEYNISLKHGNFYEKCVRLTILKIWFVSVFFAVFLPDFAWGAAVYSSLAVSIEHNAVEKGVCNTGYHVMPKIESSTFDKVFKHGCILNSGYVLTNNDYLKPVSTGITMSNTVVSIEHNAVEKGVCNTGYHVMPKIESSTFDNVFKHGCTLNSGYSLRNTTMLKPVSTGVVLSNVSVTLCEDGYWNGSACTQYQQGNCPEYYRDSGVNPNTFVAQNNNSCSSGYSVQDRVLCTPDTTSLTCMQMCNSGYIYTDAGICQSVICPYGTGFLESGVGSFQMYINQQTNPFITARVGEGKCYLNLKSGAGTENSINIRMNGTTYHITD